MSNQMPHWDNDPESWDIIFFGGQSLPGICRIENMKAGKRKTDIKTAPGTDGASIVDQGYEPASFTIIIEATEEKDAKALEVFIQGIQAKRNKALQAYTISYPMLAACSVSSVYVLDLSLDFNKRAQTLTCKLSCVEFIPLKGSKGSGRIQKSGLSPKDAVTQQQAAQSKQPQGGEAAQSSKLPAANVKPPKP
jgi:hypothetical protein